LSVENVLSGVVVEINKYLMANVHTIFNNSLKFENGLILTAKMLQD